MAYEEKDLKTVADGEAKLTADCDADKTISEFVKGVFGEKKELEPPAFF